MSNSPTFAVSLLLSTLLFGACGGQQHSDSGMPATEAATAAPVTTAPPPVVNSEPAAAVSSAPASADSPPPAAAELPLTVPIEARSGSKLAGTAKFEPSSNGVRITIDVTGAPKGKHGAHIHQNADCSSKDGKSAGDHFNPESHNHGLPAAEMRHLGDLGNLEVSKDGKGHLEITVVGASLKAGEKMSFLDRGLIIHEKVDDGSQPAGNAGARIGCAEIKH